MEKPDGCCEGVDEYQDNGEIYTYECGCRIGDDGDIYDDECTLKEAS